MSLPGLARLPASQPFPHHSYTPRIESLATLESDMWTTNQPRVDRIRGMWSDTAEIAGRVGAGLVLTGIGGDELLGYYLLLADRLSAGTPARRWKDLRAHAAWRGIPLRSAVLPGLRTALPETVKVPLRRLRRRPAFAPGLLADRAWEEYQRAAPSEPATDFGFPTDTQNLTIAASRHPLIVWSNEMQEAEYASRGLELSHPYLDKVLVEYVASIAPSNRPFDGRTKILMRDGFTDHLPSSVTSRRDKTYADDYLDALFTSHLPEIRRRYPEVPTVADDFVDPPRYRAALASVDNAGIDATLREQIWDVWTLMTWLDNLGSYGSS